MGYLWLLLLSISASFAPKSMIGISESVTECSNYVEHFWNGSGDDLYLNVYLPRELEFAGSYSKTRIKDGEEYTIFCQPRQGHPLLSIEGNPLEKIEIVVTVKNSDRPNHVSSKIKTKNLYREVNGKLFAATKKEEKVIKCPPVDLSKSFSFFCPNEERNEGVISFKLCER